MTTVDRNKSQLNEAIRLLRERFNDLCDKRRGITRLSINLHRPVESDRIKSPTVTIESR